MKKATKHFFFIQQSCLKCSNTIVFLLFMCTSQYGNLSLYGWGCPQADMDIVWWLCDSQIGWVEWKTLHKIEKRPNFHFLLNMSEEDSVLLVKPLFFKIPLRLQEWHVTCFFFFLFSVISVNHSSYIQAGSLSLQKRISLHEVWALICHPPLPLSISHKGIRTVHTVMGVHTDVVGQCGVVLYIALENCPTGWVQTWKSWIFNKMKARILSENSHAYLVC